MEQINFQEMSNDFVGSANLANQIADNAEARSISMGISNNEITNLSHALMCLDDNSFEQYISAIRVLRSTSKAFDIASANVKHDIVKSEHKINFGNIPDLPLEDESFPKQKRKYERFMLKPIDETKSIAQQIRELSKEFFVPNVKFKPKDFAKFAFDRIYGENVNDEFGEFFKKFHTKISSSYHTHIKNLVKSNGFWMVKDVNS